MMDSWMQLATRKIAGYATVQTGDALPVPDDVPSDDLLVIAARQVGVPVYPVFEDGAK